MFTVTTGVCVCVFGFYMLSSSNVTIPRRSYLLVSEHLIAPSLSSASIPGCMSAVPHNQHKHQELVL